MKFTVFLIALLAAASAEATPPPVCDEPPSNCLCGEWGYYPRQRGAVMSTDGGMTKFRTVRDPDQQYANLPDSITGPAQPGDLPDAAFLLFHGERTFPEGTLYVPPEESWEVKGRLPIVNEQVQCIDANTGQLSAVPYDIARDAGRQPFCIAVLRDAGYGTRDCGSCGCGTNQSSASVLGLAAALLFGAAAMRRAFRR